MVAVLLEMDLPTPSKHPFWFIAIFVAVMIALGAVSLFRFMVATWRDRAKERAEWKAFPAKYGLALVASSKGGVAYEGKVEGYRVMLKTGAAYAPQDERRRKPAGAGYVCIAVQCTQPQPVGLQLWKQTDVDEERKETRKLNELIIGDEELDRALIIRGKQAAQIKALLCQPEVNDSLLEFFEHWPMGIVTDYWVKCEEDTGHAGVQSPDAMLGEALELAKTLDRHALKPQGLR